MTKTLAVAILVVVTLLTTGLPRTVPGCARGSKMPRFTAEKNFPRGFPSSLDPDHNEITLSVEIKTVNLTIREALGGLWRARNAGLPCIGHFVLLGGINIC